MSPSKLVYFARAKWQLRACDSAAGTARVLGKVYVENGGDIRVGDSVVFDSRFGPSQLIARDGGKIVIGDRTYINYSAHISANVEVTIGHDCLIGQNVIILDSDQHDMFTRLPPGEMAPVVLGSRVWLGARVTVLKGVHIGNGSVIGAGSVVTRDIPAGCFAAGVPARIVREFP
jgi:acetyltransferase-like isoleucine patch superfamily enzyme